MSNTDRTLLLKWVKKIICFEHSNSDEDNYTRLKSAAKRLAQRIDQFKQSNEGEVSRDLDK